MSSYATPDDFASLGIVPAALDGIADAEKQAAGSWSVVSAEDGVRAADARHAQARSALARLYEAQNQPDKALQLYRELARSESYSSFGLEAGIRMQDLLAKHPELNKAPAVATPTQP